MLTTKLVAMGLSYLGNTGIVDIAQPLLDRLAELSGERDQVAADLAVQEYGRYFDMPTVCFRGGCLTGPAHSGAELHGFLAYLVRCAVTGQPYTVFGYKGKQVRDNIHSNDLVQCFWHFYRSPRSGAVYNMGGSRHSNCSMLEAIEMIAELSGLRLNYQLSDQADRKSVV